MTVEKTHERQNRFSGESIMLTREEAKKHDAIFYYEWLASMEDKKIQATKSPVFMLLTTRRSSSVIHNPYNIFYHLLICCRL